MCQVIEFPRKAITRPPEVISYDAKVTALRARIAWVRLAKRNLEANRLNPEREMVLIWAVDDFLKWLEKL